jgi:hypothetical protein
MIRLRLSLAVGASAVLVAGSVSLLAAPGAQAQPFNYQHLNKIQQRLVSGLLAAELNRADAAARTRSAAPLQTMPTTSAAAYLPGSTGCPNAFGANVKVNQNCLNLTDADLQGRAQAQNETWIAAQPGHPQHVVASYNDYRRGDGTCGLSFSLDGGRHWADTTVPNGYTRGTAFGHVREYWQSGGDTSVAWDTKGNAYLSCQLFKRGIAVSPDPDQSSAFYVYRSTGNNGGSLNFPGRPVAEQNDVAGTGAVLLDKQLMTVDDTVGSPFQDRVYVTWTLFAADGTAYIYEAYSADYGEHFSAPVLVSGDTALCDNTFGVPTPHGRCNENQYSQPFTGPDGALYVAFANFNNAVVAPDNRNQMLIAKSTDGGQTFSAPVRAGYYYELPDCATYQGGQDPGRACVPEKDSTANSVFRATQYPIGAVDPTHPNRVVVTYGSYVNRDSKESNGCAPAGTSPTTGQNLYTGVKTPGACNNDILLSVSTNGGATFTGSTADPRVMPVVTTASGQRTSDQWFQGARFTSGGTLAVSYYDRQYGDDETTGFSDVTVSASRSLAFFAHTRATSSSLPPPTQFSGTFWGDYAMLEVAGSIALPLWSDTRPVDLFLCAGTGAPGVPPAVCTGSAPNAAFANDQDIYVAGVYVG